MTIDTLTQDIQKQEPGSALIHLYEIDLGASSIYFHTGLEVDLTTVQFRDKITPSTVRTYAALPIEMKGFKKASSGTLARPTLTIANVLTTFGDAIGSLTNNDLLGNKVTRRSTLVKYLYGQASDQSPAVEFPSEIYYIDRIKQETAAMIVFEVAPAHDLIGVTVPARHAMSNACSWIYKGASWDRAESERKGACTVDTQGNLAIDGTTYKNWVNQDDERVVLSSSTFTAYSGVSDGTTLTISGYYTTTKTDATRYNVDGTQTGSQSVTEYWQYNGTGATNTTTGAAKTTAGTPSDTNIYFDRIRVYATYSASTTYYSYTDDRLNPYVQYTANSTTKLWKLKHTSLGKTPEETEYWELGDSCSKTIKGCAMRYNSEPITAGTAASNMKANPIDRWTLPFGGFPGARRYN